MLVCTDKPTGVVHQYCRQLGRGRIRAKHEMNKHTDIMLGAAGTTATITLAQFNEVMGALAATLTVAWLILRLFREWRNRNNKIGKD